MWLIMLQSKEKWTHRESYSQKKGIAVFSPEKHMSGADNPVGGGTLKWKHALPSQLLHFGRCGSCNKCIPEVESWKNNGQNNKTRK